MVADAPDRRTGRLVGAVAIALLLAGLTLLLEPAARRGPAAALLALGLAVGVVVALRLPASGRQRSAMERLNDAAFLVVVAAVALIAVRLARPLLKVERAKVRRKPPEVFTPEEMAPPARVPSSAWACARHDPARRRPRAPARPSHRPDGQAGSRITTGMSRRVLFW